MVNTGSPGSSPSTTLMDVPSSLTITPCRARGRASHWYFADAAVVMGLGLPDTHLFLKWALLEVKARGVGVGADEAHARSERLLALARHEDGLAPIGTKHEILLEIFGKSGNLQCFNHEIHGFAFGFRMGEEIHAAGWPARPSVLGLPHRRSVSSHFWCRNRIRCSCMLSFMVWSVVIWFSFSLLFVREPEALPCETCVLAGRYCAHA